MSGWTWSVPISATVKEVDIVRGTLHVGIDLGKQFHQVAVLGANQELVVQPFTIPRGRSGIEELLKRLQFLRIRPRDLVCTVEATGSYWQELAWGLRRRSCTVYLAHPKKAHDLRRFYALHTKTDITDAEALARMPLVDEALKPVWLPSEAVQTLQRLCRLRWKYRCRIADVKRRVSNTADIVMPGVGSVLPVRYSKSGRLFLRRYLAPEKARRVGKSRIGRILRKAAWGKFSEEKLDRLWACVENAPELGLLADDLLLEVQLQLDELDQLETCVARLDERIAELYGHVDPQQTLTQIPGLGDFLAAGVTALVGSVRRFPTPKHLISYAGLAPRVKSSAGMTRSGQGITKHGSPFLRAWTYLAADNARQYDAKLKAYFQRMRKRGKHHNVALCATAARLLKRVHDLLWEAEMQTESQDQKLGTGS
jgi:transposase